MSPFGRASTADGSERWLAPRRLAFALLLVFAASVPLENVTQLGALGSAGRIAGIAAAIGGAIALCVDLRVRRADRTLFLFGGFVTWVALSYFWSQDPTKTIARAATFAQLLLLGWLIWQEVRTSRACEALMQAFIAGTAFACLDAIVTRHPAHGGVARFSIGDPNDFGVIVVIAIVMAYHFASTSRTTLTRACCIAFLPLGTVAVFLTASRTAVVALALAALVTVVDRRNLRPRRLLVISVTALVMVVLVVNLVSAAQLDRIGSVGSEATSGTLDQRTSLWELSFQSFSHHPLTGLGADAFRDVAQQVSGQSAPAHNSFLDVLAELGLPGLLLFGLVLASVVPRLFRLPPHLRRLWLMLGLIWLVGASTLSWEHRKITWFLFFLLLTQSEACSRAAGFARRDRVEGTDLAPLVRTRG